MENLRTKNATSIETISFSVKVEKTTNGPKPNRSLVGAFRRQPSSAAQRNYENPIYSKLPTEIFAFCTIFAQSWTFSFFFCEDKLKSI